MTLHRHEDARHEARGHLCNLRDHACRYGRAYSTCTHPWQRNSTFYLSGIATGLLPWALLFGINAVSGRDDIAVNAAIAGYCLTLGMAMVVVFNIQYPFTAYWRWAALGLGTMCVVTALVTWFVSAHANL